MLRRVFGSRVVAVSAGAVLVVGVGAGTAVGHGLIGSDDIRRGAVEKRHIAANTVGASELANQSVGSPQMQNGTVRQEDLSDFVANQLNDRSEIRGLRQDVNGLEGRVTALEGEEPETINTLGHLLYGSPEQTTTVTYELAEPVPLSQFDLTFFQERVLGSGDYGTSLVLGVDVDGSGGYESDDRAWGASHSPDDLGDDTFVAMDGADPDTTVKVEAPDVPRWWSPNAAGDGFNSVNASCYNTLAELIANCDDVRFTADSTVELVRFTMGGTAAWPDEAVRFTVLDERLSLVTGDEE